MLESILQLQFDEGEAAHASASNRQAAKEPPSIRKELGSEIYSYSMFYDSIFYAAHMTHMLTLHVHINACIFSFYLVGNL